MVYHGGRVINGGYFLDVSKCAVQSVPQGGGYLPGGREKNYLRLPAALMFVVGPLAGLLYVITFPGWCLVTFVRLFGFGARKLKEMGSRNVSPGYTD